MDINAAADIGCGVADAVAGDDCTANVDGIGAAARKVEGSFGNDDTFKVDAPVEFDVPVDDKNSVSKRAISREVQIAGRIVELWGSP